MEQMLFTQSYQPLFDDIIIPSKLGGRSSRNNGLPKPHAEQTNPFDMDSIHQTIAKMLCFTKLNTSNQVKRTRRAR